MPYSQEVYRIAKERLAERRQQALRKADYNRSQLFSEIPRLREINSELLSIGAAIAKCVVKGGDEGQQDLKKLGERSLSLQEEQNQILADHRISADTMEPRYHCAACDDTGYIEQDNRTVVCGCMSKLLTDIACEQLSADLPLKDCTFENFRLDYYSDLPDENGKNPYKRMTNIYRYCVDYAEGFNEHSKSLLMRGATGLGKTHLSLAIANVVIRKGMSVIYTSAPQILTTLEREHFSSRGTSQEDTFDSLLQCDLLILDDLGTEFTTDFTRSCIYHLFNSRILAGKPTIISTNLLIDELVSGYSQRFVSRLMGSCDKLDFIGEDNRMRR